MFWHNFKYSLKTLLKSRMLLFWTFAFPIVLGIFFNMAFSNIENSEKLDVIDIAIINNEDFKKSEVFKEAFKTLSDGQDKNRMFNIKYVTLDEAEKMLEDKEITGYILFNEQNANIKVNSNGINETILRYVVDEIQSNKEIMQTLAGRQIEDEYKKGNDNINYEKIYTNINNMLIDESKVELNNISNKNLSYTMIEYYTLISMSCLYGGIISMFITNYKLANMNSVGKRTSVSPIGKGKLLLGSLLASYIVQLLGISILFLFTIFVLKVDFGTNLPLVVLLACVGSFSGLSIRCSSCNFI